MQENRRSRAHGKPTDSKSGQQLHRTSAAMVWKKAQIPSEAKPSEKPDLFGWSYSAFTIIGYFERTLTFYALLSFSFMSSLS